MKNRTFCISIPVLTIAIVLLSLSVSPLFSDTSTNNLTVAANAAPVAEDDTASTDEDLAVDIDVLANDSDPDGKIQTSSVKIASFPNHGEVTEISSTSGVVTYEPDDNYNGKDSFTYTVEDFDGAASNEASVALTILDVNDPPVASFDFSPSHPTVNDPVEFDASISTDIDGSIGSYEWDWDNDGSYESSSSTPNSEYTFTSSGTHTVTLRVVDDDGASDTDEKTVEINAVPVADAGGPYSGNIDRKSVV